MCVCVSFFHKILVYSADSEDGWEDSDEDPSGTNDDHKHDTDRDRSDDETPNGDHNDGGGDKDDDHAHDGGGDDNNNNNNDDDDDKTNDDHNDNDNGDDDDDDFDDGGNDDDDEDDDDAEDDDDDGDEADDDEDDDVHMADAESASRGVYFKCRFWRVCEHFGYLNVLHVPLLLCLCLYFLNSAHHFVSLAVQFDLHARDFINTMFLRQKKRRTNLEKQLPIRCASRETHT